ncbi:MAG: threonine/serine exporter family protein [Lachnospiraceae bacterium]
MTRTIIEMIAAFAACTGFSIIYSTRPNRLFLCGLGASLTWGVCCFMAPYTSNIFVNYMIAAAFGTILAECLAKWTKTPATIYLIPSLLPMVPGGSLYYTTFALVTGNQADVSYYGNRTAQAALGISVGLVIVSVLLYYQRRIEYKKDQRKHK